MEAKKQAGRSPAAFFAEWPLSDPAMRPTRSVTGSAEGRRIGELRGHEEEKTGWAKPSGIFRGMAA